MVSCRVEDKRFEISNLDFIKDMDRIIKLVEILSIMNNGLPSSLSSVFRPPSEVVKEGRILKEIN